MADLLTPFMALYTADHLVFWLFRCFMAKQRAAFQVRKLLRMRAYHESGALQVH